MGRLHVTREVCLLLFTLLLVAELVVAAADDGTVVLTSTPVVPEIPSLQEMKEFHVLLTLKANHEVKTEHVLPIDLIIVHKISNPKKLNATQKAMEFISRQLLLGGKDRLVLVGPGAVVTIEKNNLISAPGEPKNTIQAHFDKARTETTTWARLFNNANDKIRITDGAGAIIVLTDDTSADSLSGITTDKNYPVHIFDLGTGRNLKALSELASTLTGGTYSFVDDNDKIIPALAVCVGGLMKLVVPGTSTLKLDAEQKGVKITDIKYRGTTSSVSLRTKTIDIGMLQAGETKNILVSLYVPADEERSGDRCEVNKVTLLTATFTGRHGDQVITHVCVDRPKGRVHVIQAPPSRLVVEQIVRIELIKVIKAGVNLDKADNLNQEQLWNSWNNFVKDYKYWSGIDVVLGDLQAQIDAMDKYTREHSSSSWKHYIISWISSHETQRPTAIGSSSNVVSVFITEQVNIMVHLAVFFTENDIVYKGDCKTVNCIDVTKLKEVISRALASETTTAGTVCMPGDDASSAAAGFA